MLGIGESAFYTMHSSQAYKAIVYDTNGPREEVNKNTVSLLAPDATHEG